MVDSDRVLAVARAVAVLGATYCTVASLSLAVEPGATTARHALLAGVVGLAWLGVSGVVADSRRRWAVALAGLVVLGLANPVLSRLLLPVAGALAVAGALDAAR
jgi:hypothetical protein